LGKIPKTQETKTKTDKWDSITLKTHATKKTINRLKRQSAQWEKILKTVV
jgi:hypothetical protein